MSHRAKVRLLTADVALVACTPVDRNLVDQLRQQHPDLPALPVYPGSAIVNCVRCGAQVYLGPRGQRLPRASLMACCIVPCVAEVLAEAGHDEDVQVSILSLGNPYQPR